MEISVADKTRTLIVILVCAGLLISALMTPARDGLFAQDRARRQQLGKLAKRIEKADLAVLFIGNSHSAPIPKHLEKIFSRLADDQNVCFQACFGPFLVNHAVSESTLNLIKAGPWDYIVLQGQKYSTSGKYHYPYDGALKLSKIIKESGAKVVMFPEWSRRVEPDEYLRINKIHNEIAEQSGATVAPVGQAWKKALKEFPRTRLHAADGNHAAEAGNYLTSCVFYAILTGKSPVDSRHNKQRVRLAEIAWEIVNEDKDK